MKIGIDLDSTLVETHAAAVAAIELGYEIGNKDVTRWNHLNFPEDLRARIMQYFLDPEHMCTLAKPIEGSQETIKKWVNAGHEIILITARAEPIRKGTIEMVNRLYPEIKDINFVGMDQSKISVMLEKNVDCWIDDAPHGVLDSLSLNIDTYLISNNYTKYNWIVKDNPELKGISRTISEIKLPIMPQAILKTDKMSISDLKVSLELALKKFSNMKDPNEYLPINSDKTIEYYQWQNICVALEAEILKRIGNSEIGLEAKKKAEDYINK